MRKLIEDISVDLGYSKSFTFKRVVKIIYILLHPLSYNFKPIFLYRLSNMFWRRGFKRLALFVQFCLMRKYSCYISCSANIEAGLKLPHPIGIVIGQGVEISGNVTIYQNVTIDVKDIKGSDYARIGENTIVYAGSTIIGSINIGNNSIIGANSVVLKDVDKNSVYAGNPAKKLKDLN